jgi:hypothetical protein
MRFLRVLISSFFLRFSSAQRPVASQSSPNRPLPRFKRSRAALLHFPSRRLERLIAAITRIFKSPAPAPPPSRPAPENLTTLPAHPAPHPDSRPPRPCRSRPLRRASTD